MKAIRRLREHDFTSCLGLLLLCLLPRLYSQGTVYVIYGRVARPDDSPAVRAVVRISSEAGLAREVYTDDVGRYEIRDLPGGRYSLTAVNPAAPDQVSESVHVDLNRADSHSITVNIFLRGRTTVPAARTKRSSVVTLAEEMQDVPKSARKAFQQALNLRGENKFKESLEMFDRSIEIYPPYFQAWTERGHLRLAMENRPDAIKDFEHARQLNPRYGPALRGLGLCQFQLGDYAAAIQTLERAVESEPDNATDYYFMGVAGVALDRRELARAWLQKALNLDPKASVRAHVHLASLLIKEDRPKEAAEELEIYLDAVPDPFDGDKLRALLAQLRER